MSRFDVEVSIALGADLTADPSTWSWTDITAYTEGSVRIFRGRDNYQSQANPSWCELTVDNADGRFSRLYPLGVYYGQLRKNTPLRVRACATGGTLSTRFVGFVSEWPPRFSHGQKHLWVPIRADGILRRLGQGATPLKSALRRAYLSSDEPTPLAYWPCEDAEGSEVVASGLPGGAPMVGIDVTPHFTTGIPGAAGALDLVQTFPGSPPSPTGVVASLTLPTADGFQLEFTYVSDGIEILLEFQCGTLDTPILTAFSDGLPHQHSYIFRQNGANVDADRYRDGVFISTVTWAAGTLGTSLTVAVVTSNLAAATLMIGHIAVYSYAEATAPTSRAAAVDGFAGDVAGARFARLCTEESIAYDVAGDDVDSYAMGPQTTATLVDLLRECEAASEGVLVERKTGEIGLDLNAARENVAVALALDHDQGHVKAPFEPADDDRLTRNDITVTRTGGSSARVTDEDSITAAGRYDEAVTINLYQDAQALQHAGWRLNLGTVDQYRYPVLRLMFHSSSDILTNWLAADVGSRITIDNLPTTVTYDLADQILEGYAENVDAVAWDATLNLSPYQPYKIFEISDNTGDVSEFVGRLAGDDLCALRTAVNSSATALDFDPNAYRWTRYAGLILPGTAGNYASTPDNAALDIVGDIELRCDCTLTNWANGSIQSLVSKYTTTGNQRSYNFRISATGFPELSWSTDGAAATIATSTAAVPVADGRRITLTVWLDVNNAGVWTVAFFTATGMDDTPTQLGAFVNGGAPTSIFSSSAVLEVGSITGGTANFAVGTIHAARVLNSIGGTAVANPNFAGQALGTTSFADSAGRTWTVNGTAIIEGDFPLDVRLGGEVATVSAISTTAATFVAAGAMSSADNAAVTPALYAGAAANDWICVVGRIRRGTAAGVLTTPTGYTRIAIAGFTSSTSLQLFVKVHSGSESNPTVTPSGGAAGDTVSAFTFGLRNMPITLADLNDAVIESGGLNTASAQNIAYPGLVVQKDGAPINGAVVLIIGGKDDDWTSVATLTGLTEMLDASTTTGNDQGLVVDYVIQNYAAPISNGSFVVTGGASALSNAIAVAFAGGYQTMTVSARSVNGVSKSQAVGTRIEAEDAIVLGL